MSLNTGSLAAQRLIASARTHDSAALLKASIVAASFAAVFYHVLYELSYRWYQEPDWSHGFLVPLFSAYLAYARWEQIRTAPVRHTWVGLLIMLAGLCLYQ